MSSWPAIAYDGISKAGMANGHTGFFEQLGRDRLFGEASRGFKMGYAFFTGQQTSVTYSSGLLVSCGLTW